MADTPALELAQLRIVVLALLAGAAGVTLVVFLLVDRGAAAGDGALAGIFLGVWAALALGELAVWPLIRKPLARKAGEAMSEAPGEEGRARALQHYATATLVAAAMAEGATLFAAVAAYVTGDARLLLATLPGLLVLALMVPGEQKLQRFLARAGSGRGTATPG